MEKLGLYFILEGREVGGVSNMRTNPGKNLSSSFDM